MEFEFCVKPGEFKNAGNKNMSGASWRENWLSAAAGEQSENKVKTKSETNPFP